MQPEQRWSSRNQSTKNEWADWGFTAPFILFSRVRKMAWFMQISNIWIVIFLIKLFRKCKYFENEQRFFYLKKRIQKINSIRRGRKYLHFYYISFSLRFLAVSEFFCNGFRLETRWIHPLPILVNSQFRSFQKPISQLNNQKIIEIISFSACFNCFNSE